MTNEFVGKKSAGDICEIEVCKYLLEQGAITIERAQGRFYDWDIKITTKEGEETYEVKSDRKSEHTGNFCIEFMNTKSGGASGIFKSKADYVVYYVNKQWRKVKREDLIVKILNEKEYDIRDGGDDNSRMYIFPVTRLGEFFTETIDIPTLE